jgi:hypothetical protein
VLFHDLLKYSEFTIHEARRDRQGPDVLIFADVADLDLIDLHVTEHWSESFSSVHVRANGIRSGRSADVPLARRPQPRKIRASL